MVVASLLSLALAADPAPGTNPSAGTDQPAQPASPPATSPPAPGPDPSAAPAAPASPAPPPGTESPPAVEPAVVPVEPATVPAAPTEPARRSDEELQQLYLKAYLAWQQGRWASALEQARAILAVAPEYRPAMLLEGYALTKKSDPSEGIAALQRVAALPATTDFERSIQKRAAVLASRYTDRRRRDQVSVSVGQALVVERRSSGVALRSGAQAQLQVPVWDVVAVRADYGGPFDAAFDGLVVNGPHLAVLGVVEIPLKSLGSYLDVGVGPALWVAEGLYWPTNVHAYGGMRTALGYDWRFSRRTGLRLEGGWSWWPGMQQDLPWLTQPLDVRAGITFWFGK